MKNIFVNNFLIPVFLLYTATVSAQECYPEFLRCEYVINPIGIDAEKPRFTWRITDNRLGAKQTAYEIIVSEDSLSAKNGKGNVWQSGKIESNKTLVIYDGKELSPCTRYYWNVSVWDKDGEKSSASNSVYFETGKMREKWNARWISDSQDTVMKPAPHFRKKFALLKKIASARIYIVTAGLFELYLNGDKLGDDMLNPMFTRFDKRNLYLTYDVTSNVRQGDNAMGLILGNGWYNHQSWAVWDFEKAIWRNRPAFCLEMQVKYMDGTSEVISSGTDWKTSLGPIIFNSIYTGEHYDARMEKEIEGWNLPGFDDSKWANVMLREAPSFTVSAQCLPPIRKIKEFTSVICVRINDSVYVYKLPENIAGISKLRVEGQRGTIIRLKHGETINAAGRVDQSTIDIYANQKDGQDPFQTDIYILKGEGNEEFMPRFNYKGFQYVEVMADRPVILHSDNLIAYRINSDVRPVGYIESSDSIVNQIWQATNRSYLSNLHGYPTDCPQREKNGWTADAHIALEAALFNYEGINVYEKWMADHRDAQLENGVLPAIIPTSSWGYTWGNGVDWTSSMLIIPWTLYEFYGDTRALAENYSGMKLYVDYITSISPTGLTDWGLGDWVPYKTVANKELLISLYYYQNALILSKTANILGHHEDIKTYSDLAQKIKKSINNKFLDEDNAIYADGSQAALSSPLYFGVVPENLKQRVADNLAERVIADNKHLDVGLLGSKTLLGALSDNGYANLAFEVATQSTYPSWGWWIVNGATTLYETWKIETETLSRNHIMFGEISAWFYKALGGIHIDAEDPGFHSVIMNPHFVEKLDHFKAMYDSPNGEIISSWRRDPTKKEITYQITIPPNSIAKVILNNVQSVFDISEQKTMIVDEYEKRCEFELGSGSYTFSICYSFHK
jgi:alpha-L-rhamnosidase